MTRAERLRCVFVALVAASALLGFGAEGASGARPEQRVTELVSELPPGTQDTGVCGAQRHGCDIEVTPDGRHVLFALNQGPLYEHTGSKTTLVSTGPLGTGNVGTICYYQNNPCESQLSEDGLVIAFSTGSSLVPEDTGPVDVYLRSNGLTRLVSSVKPPPDPHPYSAHLAFMSDDGSRVWYREIVNFWGDEGGLYEWTAGKVARFPSDATPALDARVFKQGASRDGRRVFFETAASLLPGDANGSDDVYERTLDGQIKLISGDASDHAVGGLLDWASADGSQVIFSTQASRVSADTDTETDLYKRVGETTTLLTPNTSSSLVPPRPGHTPWYGVGFLASSNDGSRVFFESDEPLVPQDTDGDALDIYERVNGETRLISTSVLLPNAPIDARFNEISPDGMHVFFGTDERFVPEDTDSCQRYTDAPDGCWDVYERVGDNIRLVTTGPAAAANSNIETGGLNAVSSDGERVLFSTEEKLVADDRDSCLGAAIGCQDIYQRYKGQTTLISTGPADDQGDCRALGTGGCPSFVGASPDARTVYFQTHQSLTPNDTDGGLNDIFVSKVVAPGCKPKTNGKSPKKCE
jgi:hypothetical protein